MQPAEPIRDVRRWTGAQLCVELLPARPYAGRDPVQFSTLGLSFERQRGAHRIGGDRLSDFDRLPGTFSFVPAGLDMYSESDAGGEFLVVRFADTGATAPGVRIAGVLRERHREAYDLGNRLRSALLAANVEAADAVEAYVLSLLETALPLRPHAQDDARSPDARCVRYAIEIIEERLRCGELLISDIASELGLGSVSFLRSFRRATGLSPSDYVLGRRVRRARDLIAQSPRMSLAQIAADCGFSHQSHMGVAFRRSIGMTPSAYRACCNR